MSQKERDRLRVLHDLSEGRVKQREAGVLMDLSVRQVRRILKRYEALGDAGVVHRLRNRRSNRKIPNKLKVQALKHVQARYRDFGPTLAAEYLEEEHGLAVSRETLRGWLIEAGLWVSRRRRVRHRQWRERKSCLGELVQLDTSIHDWFEGRGETAVLIAMIDDATSRLFARFFPTDSTATNMGLLWQYLRCHGRPLAIYADKASHFKAWRQPTAQELLEGREAESQIQRALRELRVQYIPAHSPQAKGRVERSFKTAQDRLIKGMRLAEVSTIEAANSYLRTKFLPLWNRRFTVEALSEADAHRPVQGYDLKTIFSVHTQRAVANDYTIRHRGALYQILPREIQAGLRGSRVRVEEHLSGQLKIRWRDRYLRHRELEEPRKQEQERRRQREEKRRGQRLRREAPSKPRKNPPNHPWQRRAILPCRKPDISTLR